MDGFFVHPADTASPLVLFWPDIAGLREAKRQMARRLAGEGYAVFVANPYYRDVAGQQFEDFADFAGNGGWDKARQWRSALDADAIQGDARAATAWLDTQDAVDTARGIGTQGYCMGGLHRLEHCRGRAHARGGQLPWWRAGARWRQEPASHAARGCALPHCDRPGRRCQGPCRQDRLQRGRERSGRRSRSRGLCRRPRLVRARFPAYDRAEAERAWSRLLATYARAL